MNINDPDNTTKDFLVEIVLELQTIRLLLQEQIQAKTPSVAPASFAEWPTEAEFLAYCDRNGGPVAWYAKDKWLAAEAKSWAGLSNWKAYASRCRTWWEQECRPMEPKASGKSESSQFWKTSKELEFVEAEIKRIKGRGGEDTFGRFTGSEEDRLKLKELLAKRKELKAKIV